MSKFTKNAITDAFIELISERPLDKITVKDVVNKCGVNRNTFYYYYRDIYELVEDVFETETQRILGEASVFESWQDAFIKATDFAYKNRHGIYHIYKSISREQLENYLNKVTLNNMLAFTKNSAKDIDASEEDIYMLSMFYTHALVGIVLQWLNDGMREDPYTYINKLGKLLDGNIKQTLERNATPKSQTN